MRNTSKAIMWLIYLSSLLRLFLGGWVELGNDEVYYYTYAAYPDWSHFDHPPMVGWVIQLFSFGGYLSGQLWMRIGAIALSAINTFVIWRIGSLLKNDLAGWYAALLYTASFYTSVIAGLFIMPDTPQVFFWLLSLWLMLRIAKADTINTTAKRDMLLLGCTIGLAMLSKYTSAYLWLGFLLYVLFYRRQWLARPQLYVAGVISLLVFSPVIYWNLQNNFISFTFHEGRVHMSQGVQLHWDYLGAELGGSFLYQNPIVFVLLWAAVFVSLFGKPKPLSKAVMGLLLLQSLPLIITFIGVSLFKRTLPHWSGPGYVALLLLAAALMANKHASKPRLWTWPLALAIGLFVGGVLLAGWQVNRGLVPLQKLGNDPTLDMYGWRYMGHQFKDIKEDTEYVCDSLQSTPLLATNWFEAAHLDYYVAQPSKTPLLVWGSLGSIHKYAWINKARGGLQPGMNAWYFSFDKGQDVKGFALYFKQIEFVSTVPIYRNGELVKEAYLFLFKDLHTVPQFDWMETVALDE